MHPALSVIAFTTLSGAGYGLLIWLGWLIPFHRLPLPPGYAPLTLALALLLITVGLLSSLAHLGRPERAWRALSQWRSSWLSREGVLAILCYLPALAMLAASFGWIGAAHLRWLGPVSIVLALATVHATSMIYASLRTVAAWNHASVPALYIAFALASGCLLAALLLAAFLPMERLRMPLITAFITNLIAWAVQWYYWHRSDRLYAPRAASAVALPANARVRPFEKPHSEDSFITREMVFRFARERAANLRRLAVLSGVVLCFICMSMAFAMAGPAGTLLLVFACLFQLLGIFVSRWLFFAEARHIVGVYYDVDARA
jgi:DMSO reductase anchor subunit